MKARLEEIAGRDGSPIPTRVWHVDGATAKATPVVMTHGLQSHSGLFARSQAHLASLGLPVYAFDRRGSGRSRERRGDCGRINEGVSVEMSEPEKVVVLATLFPECSSTLSGPPFSLLLPVKFC